MELPKGQDVIADITGWTSGPLPSAELEHIAFVLFSFRYPRRLFDDPLFHGERQDCRCLALQLRLKFIAMDRWSIDNAHEKLADRLALIIFGSDRRLGPTIRREILDYAEAFIADAWGHFKTRLFHAREVDANARELAIEDAHGR